MGGYTIGLRPTLSLFLCVSGQRGTIAKSMHEEHLCIVALTSNGARNPVLSAYLLPPCVIAYLLLFVYFQVNNGVVYLDYEDSHRHGPLLCSFQLIVLDLSLLFDDVAIGLSFLLLVVSLHGD